MKENGIYISFCRIFHNLKIPKIRFRELNHNYKFILRKEYKIEPEDIYKGTFIIFTINFLISFLLSIIFTNLNLIIIISYSFILSLIFAYLFNMRFYRTIYKNEMKMNALLYLIKINFSILQKSLSYDSDFALMFIKLIKESNLPISNAFKKIIKRIQEGNNLEEELIDFVSPSEDFNKYVKELIIDDFKTQSVIEKNDSLSLENKFKIYLKQIETRLSIIFFIGLFFPLGLGFLVLFNKINLYTLFLIIPLFFIFQKILYNKFIKSNIFLLGLLNNYTKKEKKKFEEFLFFLKHFAKKLKKNLSPEKAFINSYFFYKDQLHQINKSIKIQVNRLLNFTCSFNEMMEFLKYEFKSFRYWIIINVLKDILLENAYESSEKILDILNLISKHKNLEKKLELIIKGEKFKVFLFLFLLPIIVGAIGGTFPLFILITKNLIPNNPSIIHFFNLVISYEFFVIFSALLGCVLTSSYYFLKIINSERIIFFIITSCIIYILTFFISYLNIINLI